MVTLKCRLLTFLCLFLLSANALAGTLTGTLLTSGGNPIPNGTLTFSLSQTAYKSDGTGVSATSPTSCYTSTDGSIVGVPNSLVSPVVSNSGAGGTIAANTYYVKIAYWNATGTGIATLVASSTTTTGSTSSITVNMPALQPAMASGIKIYVGTALGSETLQSTVTGFSSAATLTSYAVGSAFPATNTSACSLLFNDTLIPSFTTYKSAFLDANGNKVPGWPQSYYFAGTTVNLALATPSGNLKVNFPSAIIASPSGQATQSVNGGLTITGQLTPNSGVNSNGGGFKHKRTTINATNGIAGYAVAWSTAFADQSYSTTCSIIGGGAPGNVSVMNISGLTASALTVQINNTSGGTLNALLLDCIAVHD